MIESSPERRENLKDGQKDRQQILEEKRTLVESFYTDYNEEGKERVGIDPELKEGIAVLLAAGFQTEQSCWGHPERRDDHEALHAEKNLFPYIVFTGYQPTDGLNEKDEAIGFSKEQVDAACVRMQHDVENLKTLLGEFYEKHQIDPVERWVELRYFDGMPGAELATRGERVWDEEDAAKVDREKQDLNIAQAQAEWSAFLEFVKEEYVTGKL